MNTNALEKAIEFAIRFFNISCEDVNDQKLLYGVISLILDGDVEKAFFRAEQIADDDLRVSVQYSILELLEKPSIVSSTAYGAEAYVFTCWFLMQKLEEDQTALRYKILRDIFSGVPILADSKADRLKEITSHSQLSMDVSRGVDDLVTSWYHCQ
jgi:hypothetical protein